MGSDVTHRLTMGLPLLSVSSAPVSAAKPRLTAQRGIWSERLPKRYLYYFFLYKAREVSVRMLVAIDFSFCIDLHLNYLQTKSIKGGAVEELEKGSEWDIYFQLLGRK